MFQRYYFKYCCIWCIFTSDNQPTLNRISLLLLFRSRFFIFWREIKLRLRNTHTHISTLAPMCFLQKPHVWRDSIQQQQRKTLFIFNLFASLFSLSHNFFINPMPPVSILHVAGYTHNVLLLLFLLLLLSVLYPFAFYLWKNFRRFIERDAYSEWKWLKFDAGWVEKETGGKRQRDRV